MTRRRWVDRFTDEELVAYGKLVDDWTESRTVASLAEQLSRWVEGNVRVNSDGSFTFSHPSTVTPSRPPEEELKLGDTKPLDDFLETFSIKE